MYISRSLKSYGHRINPVTASLKSTVRSSLRFFIYDAINLLPRDPGRLLATARPPPSKKVGTDYAWYVPISPPLQVCGM